MQAASDHPAGQGAFTSVPKLLIMQQGHPSQATKFRH